MKTCGFVVTVLLGMVVQSAVAQSSVTLYGVVDATLGYGRGSLANKIQLTHSGMAASRLGFRGTEDLGGGMSASFWLEAGLANDSGTGQATNINNQVSGTSLAPAGSQGITFNRRSTVSLASELGELRLGRDFTPQFWNLTIFDPFGTSGVGTTQVFLSSLGGPVTVRASNSIGYFLPRNLAGVYGQLQYYLGENLRTGSLTDRDGTGVGGRIGYSQGPFNAALAYSSTKYAAGDIREANIAGEWNLGRVKLVGEYSRDRVASAVPVGGHGGLLGAVISIGRGEIPMSYSSYETDAAGNPKTTKLAVGYVHNLSKRTALYATYARLRNRGGAAQSLNGSSTAVNNGSSGFDLGLRHSF